MDDANLHACWTGLFTLVATLTMLQFMKSSKRNHYAFSKKIEQKSLQMMASSYCLIPEITEEKKAWVAKVIAVAKLPPKTSKGGSEYQHLLLLDTEGNTVQATLWNKNINAFANDFLPGKTYKISNAYAKKKPDYNIFGGQYIWTISATTKVELMSEDYSSFLFSTFQFTNFGSIPNYLNTAEPIGIIGIALKIYPKRLTYPHGVATSVQDILLMDKDFQTVTLTLWEQYIETEGVALAQIITRRPIVIGQNLNVKYFNGITLYTQKNSYFYVDPGFEETKELKEWVMKNASDINAFLRNTEQFPTTPKKLAKPNTEPLTTVQQLQQFIQTNQSKKNLWLKATAKVLERRSSFAYLACNICNTASSTDKIGDIFSCRFCKTNAAVTIARARADVQLQDSTGTIQASMMGDVAEEFFQCSATDIIMNTGQENMRIEINEEQIFYLKLYPKHGSSSKFTAAAAQHSPGANMKLEVLFISEPNVDESTTETPFVVDDTSSVEHQSSVVGASSMLAKRPLFHDESGSSTSIKKICNKEKFD